MGLTQSQYTTIKRIYDKNRQNALRIQDEHLAKVREAIPEYSILEDQATHIAVEYSLRMISGEITDISECDRLLAEISERKAALLAKHGYTPDYLEPPFVCPKCQDQGYIDNQKCTCFRQAEIELLYKQSNIRDFLGTENFGKMRMDLQQGEDLAHFQSAAQECQKFIEHFDNEYTNIMLYGTVGTGKSFLSACIAHELLDSGHSVIYFSSTELFSTISDITFRHSGYDEDDLSGSDLYECDLLVIDDLGTELTNQFVCSSLFTCLNERHIRGKSTIISTNLSLSELHERYSDRVFSRAVGNFKLLKLTGTDARLKIKN